jgi:hypothetical protein
MKDEKEVNERGSNILTQLETNNSDLLVAFQVYRKLIYYYENKISVHFSLCDGRGWKNGDILDLSEKKLTVVLKEFREGELPFLCEEIKLESIAPYKEVDNNGGKNI